MIGIRIHGRGGQGAVAAAELIAITAFKQGYWAQSFPFFGVERSGAPIQAFVRIDEEKILTHAQIEKPDYLIIQDDSLLLDINIYQGISVSSKVLINTQKDITAIDKMLLKKIAVKNITLIDASQIAFDHLRKNIINTALLGAFSATYPLIEPKQALAAIAEKFSHKGQTTIKLNQKIFLSAYEQSRKK